MSRPWLDSGDGALIAEEEWAEILEPRKVVKMPGVTLESIRALAAEKATQNPQLYTRISKAVHILAMFEPRQNPDDTWTVQSETGLGEYIVSATTCACPDFGQLKNAWCKHRIAVSMLQELTPAATAARQQETRAPARIAGGVPPSSPGPRAPEGDVCPTHRQARPGRWGLFCPAKLDNGSYCKWSTRQPVAA